MADDSQVLGWVDWVTSRCVPETLIHMGFPGVAQEIRGLAPVRDSDAVLSCLGFLHDVSAALGPDQRSPVFRATPMLGEFGDALPGPVDWLLSRVKEDAQCCAERAVEVGVGLADIVAVARGVAVPPSVAGELAVEE